MSYLPLPSVIEGAHSKHINQLEYNEMSNNIVQAYMSIREVIKRIKESNTYRSGVHTGLTLMKEHYGWVESDWLVDEDDIGSDYRLLITTLQQMLDQG